MNPANTSAAAAEAKVELLSRASVRPSQGPAGRDRDSALRRALALGDLLAGGAAMLLTLLLLGSLSEEPALLLVPLMAVPLNKLLGLYDRDSYVINKTTLDELPRLINSAMVTAFVTAAIYDITSNPGNSFDVRRLLLMVVLITMCTACARVAARFIVRRTSAPERLMLIGDAEACEWLEQKIALSHATNHRVVLSAPISAVRSSEMRELRRSITLHGVERMIVIPDNGDAEEAADTIRAVKSFDVKVSVLPRLFESIGSSAVPDEICGVGLIGLRDLRMSRSSRAVKRTLDVAVASAGLIFFSPLFIVAAVAIRIDSQGPVFYRSRRIGRNGEPFNMFKFRTMIDGADRQRAALTEHNETSGLFKIEQDPRVTRVGRRLRGSSLDELPQLLNVLAGDMSIVGPRPLVPDEDENITGWYRRRSQITPGITGAWQLHGPLRIPLQEMVKIDYAYVTSWSIWSDVKIMLRTVPHMLGQRGV